MEKSENEKIGFGGNVNGTLKTPSRRARKYRPQIHRYKIMAPLGFWSYWQEVIGHIGTGDHNTVVKIPISISQVTRSPSSFDYEIKGGDRFIRGVAAGSGVTEMVTITGNVATGISVRVKSHSVAQEVNIQVN